MIYDLRFTMGAQENSRLQFQNEDGRNAGPVEF